MRGSDLRGQQLQMGAFDLRRMMLLAGILRMLLVLYGEWQDAHMQVRYTDVDYLVFSDAAALLAAGKSPFQRSTYRYSPLLAAILVPNAILHRTWGKFIFSFADILVGLFTYIILRKRGVPEAPCLYSVAAWLFNPFTFTIGTRGNCEPVVCAMILWIIVCLMDGNVLQAAFWYGLVVHFRIYPIIYSIPLVIVLNKDDSQPSKRLLRDYGCTQSPENTNAYAKISDLLQMAGKPHHFLRNILIRERVMFTLFSASIFLFCTIFFFCIYGFDFLHEALLYHLTRVDPRHNFSIYFYHIYLSHQSNISILEKLVSFLPQLMVQAVLILSFAQDLPFCFFVQTVAFVAFNKVITAQYFVWFFCLLPLILPWTTMKFKGQGLRCILVWMLAQIHWLAWAYLLEFKGKNVFIQLWLASILFLVANSYVLVNIIRHHSFSPLFIMVHDGNSLPAKKIK